MTETATTQTLKRGHYGELLGHYPELSPIILLALPPTYITESTSKRFWNGTSLTYDLYDIDDRRRMAIVQQRITTGSKYGYSTQKRYFLLTWKRGKATAEELDSTKKSQVVKLAKVATRLGDVIAALYGTRKTTIKLSGPATPTLAYKAFALVDGEIRSIYDGHKYEVGGTYRQPAKPNHKGGYYWYKTAAAAKCAAVPPSSKHVDAPRVIGEIRVSGRRVSYGDKKASTQMTLIQLVD